MSIDIEGIRTRRANLLDDPGWVVDIDGHLAGGGPIYGVAMPDLDDLDGGWMCLGEPRFIVEFVAHAPADVAALLAEVDRLTTELAEAQDALDRLCRLMGRRSVERAVLP